MATKAAPNRAGSFLRTVAIGITMDANRAIVLAEYAPANDAERTTLEAEWGRGQLDHHRDLLLQFLDRDREEIVRLAGDPGNPFAVLDAVKQLIIEAGGVNHRAEVLDQLKPINAEIWIRGERGECNRELIVHQWTWRHARNWRRWRLKEYIFLVEKFAVEITRRVASHQPPGSPPIHD